MTIAELITELQKLPPGAQVNVPVYAETEAEARRQPMLSLTLAAKLDKMADRYEMRNKDRRALFLWAVGASTDRALLGLIEQGKVVISKIEGNDPLFQHAECAE